MGSLDVTSRAYEPPVLARFALEISKALTVLDGEILVLLPGMSAAMQAKELLDGSALAWPAADRDRVSVSSLGMQGPPASDSVLPAAVVLVGLTPALDSDDSSLRDARAWMRSGAVAVAINPKLPSPRPVEMNDFEAAYCLMSYTVARTDTYKKDGNLYQEDAGSAVLWRKFPDRWRVLSDYGNTREWTLVDELPTRPSEDALSTMLLPGVQKRQAAIDSTKQALGGGAGAGGGGGPSPSASSSRDEVVEEGGVGGVGPANRDALGVVTINWEQIQEAGSFGPTAMYNALVLHRIRTLQGDACTDTQRDERGLHVLLTERAEDASAAWTKKFGKLKGGLSAACQLVPDGLSKGIATIEQLAIGPKASGKEAEFVIARAIAEARAAGQSSIVALAPIAAAGSVAEAALTAAGFGGEAVSLIGLSATAELGAVGLVLDGPVTEEQEAEFMPSTEEEEEEIEVEVEEEGVEADDAIAADETTPGASQADIEMLKRMFGGGGPPATD